MRDRRPLHRVAVRRGLTALALLLVMAAAGPAWAKSQPAAAKGPAAASKKPAAAAKAAVPAKADKAPKASQATKAVKPDRTAKASPAARAAPGKAAAASLARTAAPARGTRVGAAPRSADRRATPAERAAADRVAKRGGAAEPVRVADGRNGRAKASSRDGAAKGRDARVAAPAVRGGRGIVVAQDRSGPGLKATRKRVAAETVAVASASVAAAAAAAPPPSPMQSLGQMYGLHEAEDALALRSSVALVVDQDTDEVLVSKNPRAVLPIASITKLMTALVVMESRLPMAELLAVEQEDVDATAGNRSRLRLGTQLNRADMLHLSLMSSENRAAHVLGRTYPGGMTRFVEAMNAKARVLGMGDTHFVEPTGLSSANQSSARDLARLVKAAAAHPAIRELSTSPEAVVAVGDHAVQFRNTNRLVNDPDWEIGLQKTGYIAAAGRCMVIQAQMAGRKLIMVLLDSAGKYSRIGDAERIRRFLLEPGALLPAAAGGAAAAAAAAAAATQSVTTLPQLR